MEYLWTPWRMSYISGKTGSDGDNSQSTTHSPKFDEAPLPQVESTGCVFCDRARLPESTDRESLIVLRAEHNFVILNLYPYNSAHLMVVPYEHTADLAGLGTETTV